MKQLGDTKQINKILYHNIGSLVLIVNSEGFQLEMYI